MARIQIMTPGHALACALFGNLRPSNHLILATGAPSSHLAPLLDPSAPGSLSEWGVSVSVIPLSIDGSIDLEAVTAAVSASHDASNGHATGNSSPVAVLMQRAASATAADAVLGTANRRAISIEEIAGVVAAVRAVDSGATVIVDNHGAELTDTREPGHVGVDLVTGSLTGNLGGSIATEGGYVAGRSELVARACARLSAPGLSLDAGSVPGDTQRLLFQGVLFITTLSR